MDSHIHHSPLSTRLAETACDDAIKVAVDPQFDGFRTTQMREAKDLLEMGVRHEWMARFLWKYAKCEDCKTFAKVFTFGRILGVRPFVSEAVSNLDKFRKGFAVAADDNEADAEAKNAAKSGGTGNAEKSDPDTVPSLA